MARKIVKSCDDSDLIYTYDYSANVSVKNKEADPPKIYSINFFHNFEDDAQLYKPYLDVFSRARAVDEIVIYLNSEGGSVITLNLLINAMATSECRNITARVNFAASSAAIFALACPKIIFNANSILMLHAYSATVGGKEQEISSQLKAYDKLCADLYTRYLTKILSEKELNDLRNGKDFYFTGEEAIKRIKKYRKS